MSVLYKALARASKTREAAGSSGGAIAPVASAAPRRRGFLRPLIILGGIVVVVGVVYVTFGSTIGDTINVILYGEPGINQTVAAVPPPAPTPRPQAAAATSAAGVAVPSQAAALATIAAVAAGPSQPQAAEAMASSPPLETFAPKAVAAEPETTEAAAVAEPPNAELAAPSPAASKVATVSPEQNLPAILDQIRQERAKPAASSSVTVNRSHQTPNALDAPTAASGMVSVDNASADERDDANRAYDLLLHGQYQGALALYNQVLQLDAKSLPGLLGKAIALHKLGNYAEARQLYQRVLAIDSNNREALTNVTSIIAGQAPLVALNQLRDLQKTHPDFSPISAEIAAIQANTGNLPAAIGSFNRAIALSPENGLYRLNLAILQDRVGMSADAAVSYQAALDRLGTGAGAQLPIPLDSIRARLSYLRSKPR